LSACGGGSSGTANPPAGGAPSPTPTPTPVVTPTPTPTPSPDYNLASDFTRDRSFNAIGVRLFVTAAPDGSSTVLDSSLDTERAAIGFDFSASTRTYRARYNSESLTAATELKSFMGYTYDRFEGPSSFLERSPSFAAASYVGYLDWRDYVGNLATDPANRATLRLMLFGARTLATDLPTTSSKTFTGLSSTFWSIPSEGRPATISVDYAARTVSIETIYQPPATGTAGSGGTAPSYPITMTGVFDPATGRISGTVNLDSAAANGSFEGALYGPRAAEAGIVFKGTGANRAYYYGFIIAKS